MTETLELLDAFADGEPVDPQALRSALADPAARDYFVDLLELRGLVHTQISLDAPVAAPPDRAWTRASLLRASAAVAIVGVAASAGFAIGRGRPAPTATSAVTMAPAVAATPAVVDATVAPEPTRVIRLEPGVEWHQRAGGH